MYSQSVNNTFSFKEALINLVAKFGKLVNGEPHPISVLLAKEKTLLASPDSPAKFKALAQVYKELSNGYAIKSVHDNFSYLTQVDEYNKLSNTWRNKYLMSHSHYGKV